MKLAFDFIGRGIGTQLYCIINGKALPNTPSIVLHKKMGSQKVVHLKEVGWKWAAGNSSFQMSYREWQSTIQSLRDFRVAYLSV